MQKNFFTSYSMKHQLYKVLSLPYLNKNKACFSTQSIQQSISSTTNPPLYYPEIFDLKSDQRTFYASDLKIVKTTKPLPHPLADPNIMKFGTYHTDHLLEIDWTEEEGWQKPQIVPFKNFEIHPFASCLHYAIECFEGSKAYKNKNGDMRWYRPQCSMFRMKKSAERLGLPDFDGQQFIQCIEKLIEIDRDWIPQIDGFSAYLRPTFIATEETLGVRAPTKAKLFCCISPVGPYFPSGFKPIKIYCNTENVRAGLGGVGQFKVGGNYAPTIQPNKYIESLGYNQSLWMLPNGLIQEMGVCNLFFLIKNKDGEKELVTPILDGTILPGVTRDSVLRISRQMNQFIVSERQIHIDEIIEALFEERVYEMFGTGTAVNIQPISTLGYQDQKFELKINPLKNSGDLAHELNHKLQVIQTGDQPHPWINNI